MQVTIVAPGPKSEGGIRSVVERIIPYLDAEETINVHWIASHRQGSAISKSLCLLGGLIRALWLFPGSSIVHLHGSVGTSLFRKSLFIWLAAAFGCRIVYHFHATVTVFNRFFESKSLLTRFANASLAKCDVIVVLSETWQEIVERILPRSKIEIIYNPVLNVTDSGKSIPDREPKIVYLAHLIERKGYRDLIKAFQGVVAEITSAELIFCGSGEERKARALCAELNIEQFVKFRGWVSDEVKAHELAQASAFCLPSYDEGLPMGVLEAMSAGVPIVTTPVGGIPDVLRDEYSALFFEPGDVLELRDQLTRLLEDREFAAELASNALTDSERFRPATIAQDWIELYERVAAATAP